MNPDSDQNFSSTRDDLIDAALSEHARLGTASDEGLLATVRARTIEMPGAMEPVKISEARFGAGDWMRVAAMVTVVLGLLWLVLQIGAVGPVFEPPRSEDTLRLVVIPQSASDEAASQKTSQRVPKLPVSRIPNYATMASGESGTNPAIEGLPGGMSFEAFELADVTLSTELLSEFSISAEKIVRGKDDRWLVYEGDVVVKHPDFTLKADRLELAANLRGKEKLVGAFVASGDEIEIDRFSAGGAIESARARQVTYEAEGGALILEGAPSLSSGASFVVPESVGGMIVLRQNGFQVIEPAAAAAAEKH